MPLDQDLRNALRRNVNRLRELIHRSTLEQLEGTYGIRPDGSRLPPEDVPPLQASGELARRRAEIDSAIAHERANASGSDSARVALERFALAATFTLLNRLAALKLLECRALVPECLASGRESDGFRTLREMATDAFRGDPGDAYCTFLFLIFDEIGAELPALFDRSLPHAQLFPDEATLGEVLALLNDPEIASAWDADETLGWVYQYFTPEELRRRIRHESSQPRDTYELAIRNQFYTPHYVVRFMVENTLGRIWWEMNPETSLKQREYLVHELDERPPDRAAVDPRSVRILDPACGSGHFLHFCFEMLQVIYREAWDGHAAGVELRRDYPDRDSFERAMPALILQNNLYGIDIDLRATQLTAMSLYLRAKRERPDAVIRRVNAIHAGPMPGDRAQLETFLASLDAEPNASILKALVVDIWQQLDTLAAEAGTLLKAEQTIRRRIVELREQVADARTHGRQLGLGALRGPGYEQGELVVTPGTPAEFWDELEGRIVELLRAYASAASNGGGVARRLFTEDALHGMAFLDALLQPYDVVVMNPPFGDPSKPSKEYIDEMYPRTKNDVYAAFVERGLELLRLGGYLGAITSRTGFFLTSFQKWREEVLLKNAEIVTFADLGAGVLDTAMVETAAYALRRVG